MKYFNSKEMVLCFRENGARCRECPLKQPAEKLPDGVEANLKALVTEVLEPARQRLGIPIMVNSGYRCPKHNALVGGVANSQHMKGEAADIAPMARFQGPSFRFQDELKRLQRIIVENGVFDQLIVYPTFLHVSYKRHGNNRKQIIIKK
jgi:hypothetical protein